MSIAFLGAMDEEVRLVRAMMTDVSERTIAKRTYYEGKINGYDVVLVSSRWAKVASAITATTLINTFNAEFVLFTGLPRA